MGEVFKAYAACHVSYVCLPRQWIESINQLSGPYQTMLAFVEEWHPIGTLHVNFLQLKRNPAVATFVTRQRGAPCQGFSPTSFCPMHPAKAAALETTQAEQQNKTERFLLTEPTGTVFPGNHSPLLPDSLHLVPLPAGTLQHLALQAPIQSQAVCMCGCLS